MTIEEVRAELARCAQLPKGRAKAQRIESLAEEAKATEDHLLEAQVLLALSRAYEFSSQRERMPVAFGRLLQLLDNFPADVGGLSFTIHWQLKWLSVGLIRHPGVPLPTVHRWLDECENRFRQRGYSPRPVHGLRGLLALNTGDNATASTQMEASLAAVRDEMADCLACEHNDWGTWRAALRDDEGALEYWAPVLDGARRCNEEPHRTLAKALLPLLRTGRADEARSAFLRGYPLVRRNVSLMPSVGRHAEFCALTGNEARGLEILAEHAGWLDETDVDADARLDFITGVTVLLRRLSSLGHDALPIGTGTVANVRAALEAEISQLCARYDKRNGTSAFSDRAATRLAQEPLSESLPLGLPSKLPAPSAPTPVTPVAPATPSAKAAPVAPGATLDDLIAGARELAEIRHPDTGKAWAAVADRAAADGADLPAEVARKVARARAARLLEPDPGAARELLLEVAAGYDAVGDADGSLEARATAAVALGWAAARGAPATPGAPGDKVRDEARDEVSFVVSEAQESFAAGQITPRNYLNVLLAARQVELDRLREATERAVAAQAPAEEGPAGSAPARPEGLREAEQACEETIAVAERHGQGFHAGQCHLMLAQFASWQRDAGAMREHFAAARETFLNAGTPWLAAQPEDYLARLAMRDGDAEAAEQLMKDALRHGGTLLPAQQAAQMWSVLTEAISRQDGRGGEFAAASLEAAARWDGISEPDTLHHTFNAARAYFQMGRNAEAAALFGQAIGKVDVPYDARGIAMTRDQYARSLRETGQHAEAAEQFLQAVRLLDGDEDNKGVHALLAAFAAGELERSGQPEMALAAFRRAAELFGALGEMAPRARCLRSAAWLEFAAAEGGKDQDPAAERPGVPVMRSVLSELEAAVLEVRAAGDATEDLTAEVTAEVEETRKQLDAMLNPDS